ncbi:fumarate reductase subunit C [Accumulibacter sp.]|uniref:fumarate reductase subunit C n=1 Tax=Accumulibacter sp. TaxID=2053492 RepID=UPI0025E8ACA5|nr:fumarate reductase subunit C [Accumulibacter sp.]MCM8596742.1 fumarate reductase subunit C [Accumulibacter sp.]MCM8624724.1 fumarate reductase subunit C [Accumulibacter sp.]MDS4050891.1 fumarate reductase subunit C [Accumulibacter sp.]
MSKRRPYVRSMDGWWRRNPYFVEYMIHEGTALFVAAYAGILLAGLVRLAEGEAAWNAWLAALKNPWYVGFHLFALAALAYHSFTWFKIMPRTMPPVIVEGQRLPAWVITGGGLAAAVVASLILLGVVWGMVR